MIYFSRALQPGTTQKVHQFLPVKQMDHLDLTKGHSGIDCRSVIY